jgi:LmbE family N-acetylglucosaminyl deacetylase
MPVERLRFMAFGAHPDDCDLRCGGMAMKYRALGHAVKFVSVTNGDTGHHEMGGGMLARRRYAETQAAAAVADIEYEVLDIHNGELQPDLPTRKIIVRLIREFRPDLVICHRANDYHPDHRAVGVLVQDAIFQVTLPNFLPLTPELPSSPVLGYAYDYFTDPTPYVPTVAIDTDDVFERKIDMVACHASQMFEWLARGAQLPEGNEERRAWLAERQYARFGELADRYRDCLVRWYGPERGSAIKTTETVMISEYGRRIAEDDMRTYFPFLPE